MADTTAADLPMAAQTNGIVANSSEFDEEERAKMRPADIDADVREMERRKRVELIMNSKLFREELERIIEVQLRDGSSTSGLMQQISDMMGGVGRGGGGGGHSFKHTGGCVLPINDIRGLESMGYAKGEKILRCKLACVYRLIDLYGWTQSASNLITARLNQDEEHFLVNPYGMLFHEITASSLIKVDMQGNVVEQGTTNFPVHLPSYSLHAAIHSARPDIRCILHIATPSVIAVSAVRGGLLPLSREAAVIGQVSRHSYYGGFDPVEKDRLIQDLGAVNKVLLLTNQGAVCCGQTIEEAFFNARNTVLACESQLKLMPIGIDNLLMLTDDTCKQLYDAAHRAPENSPRPDQPSILETKVERKWRVGGVEFEALMRMLDNAGFRTGYIYRHPLVKGDPPRPRNDVEVPPAVSSLGYLLEEEEMYKQGLWKKLEGGRKGHDRSRWLNSPNVYQKVEILETGTPDPKKITKWVTDESPTHSSTPVKIESALQFVPKNTNPKEFKVLQQQLKDYRRADRISAGPQSQILEGVTWEEARKMQDAGVTQTGDHVVLMGAASKGIIQRGYQHNATMYKAPYAKNPFDCVTDEELDEYKKDIERKKRGEYDTDYSESEGLSSAHINKRISDIRSPTSETEEESRDEPQVLRIETKHAQKASQPEVVLSDVHDLDSLSATKQTANIRPIRTISRTSLRAVPALTPTAASVNRALYRTNTHCGLPKGRYAQPNPLHFHITRYTNVAAHYRPTFINIRYPKRQFNASKSFRSLKNDNVSLKIGNSEPISLNLSVRSLKEFIYPFADVLNLNLADRSKLRQNLTSSSYMAAENVSSRSNAPANDDTCQLDGSCQSLYLNGGMTDSTSDFEVNIINNMHDLLMNDLSTNFADVSTKGFDNMEEFVYDYVNVEVGETSARRNLDFDQQQLEGIYEDVGYDETPNLERNEHSLDPNNLKVDTNFDVNRIDGTVKSKIESEDFLAKNPSTLANIAKNFFDVLNRTKTPLMISDAFLELPKFFENAEVTKSSDEVAEHSDDEKMKCSQTELKESLVLFDEDFYTNIDSIIETYYEDQLADDARRNRINGSGNIAVGPAEESRIFEDRYLMDDEDDELLGENELRAGSNEPSTDHLDLQNVTVTIFDLSANGKDFYSTYDVVPLLNFTGSRAATDFILTYYSRVLANLLRALKTCTAIGLNETIRERKYGRIEDETYRAIVMQDADALQVVQITTDEITNLRIYENASALICSNYVNETFTFGNKTLVFNIKKNISVIERGLGDFVEELSEVAERLLKKVLHLLVEVKARLGRIETIHEDKFISNNSRSDNEAAIMLGLLQYLEISKSIMPITYSSLYKREFGILYLPETIQFLRHFDIHGPKDIPNLTWDLEIVRDYLTQNSLVLSFFDVRILMASIKKRGTCYDIHSPNNKRCSISVVEEDFCSFVEPWMSEKQRRNLEREHFEEFFEDALNWMFDQSNVNVAFEEDYLAPTKLTSAGDKKTNLDDHTPKKACFNEANLKGTPLPLDKSVSKQNSFETSQVFELPNDFEFELNELLNDLVEDDRESSNGSGEFEEPGNCVGKHMEEEKCSGDLAEINEQFGFSEKNYNTYFKYHQKVVRRLVVGEEQENKFLDEEVCSGGVEHSSGVFKNALYEEDSKVLPDFDFSNFEVDDFYLSDEGLGNSINATKTVTPRDENDNSVSTIYYDETTTKLAELILTFIKEQSYEIKELVIFPDLLGDSQIQKLLGKLLELYKTNCHQLSDVQKNELRLNIAAYCLNHLELNDSNDSSIKDGPQIVSDKVFSITEFISDILDQFFDTLPMISRYVAARNETVNSDASKTPRGGKIKSPRPVKLIPQKTSTPENRKKPVQTCFDGQETVTAFHMHKRNSSERFWVSINKSPSQKSPFKSPKVTVLKSSKAKEGFFNIDDIPLKPPPDFDQFKFVVNDSEDWELDDEPAEGSNLKEEETPFKSRLATFEERVKLDNLFTEMQADFNLPSSKLISPLPAILEESNCNLFSDSNYTSDDDDGRPFNLHKLTASKVTVNLLNDTHDSSSIDSFDRGDYIAFDRPEINVIVSSEVNFYRTNTINASAFLCQTNVTFTKELTSPNSSYMTCNDSRSNDRDSSLDENDGGRDDNESESSGNWLGYEKAIF